MSVSAEPSPPGLARSSRPLSILSVATTYPRWSGDTERAFVHDLNRALVARGHHLHVLAPHAPGAARHETLDGIDVQRFRYAPESFERLFYGGGALPNLRASWRARLALPGALLALRAALRRAVIQVRPDVLHVHWLLPQGYFALAPASTARVPLVVTVHGADIHQLAQGRLRFLARKVIAGANALTANTPHTARAIEQLARPKRVEILPMGLDLALFNPTRRDPALRAALGLRGPWLLGVGRFVEKKGFIYLIEALPEILRSQPGAVVTLGGEGPERAALESRAKALGVADAVKFLGPLTREVVARYMASADVFVGPSIVDSKGDTEAQGVVFVEALASGCPVVASTAGGIPDVLTHGVHGRLVPPRDSVALAAAILECFADQPATRRQIAAGLERAQGFSWGRIVAGFEKLFGELV